MADVADLSQRSAHAAMIPWLRSPISFDVCQLPGLQPLMVGWHVGSSQNLPALPST
jgi:hypothetical protein